MEFSVRVCLIPGSPFLDIPQLISEPSVRRSAFALTIVPGLQRDKSPE